MDLIGKTILITGGRRVGLAIAEELAIAGADIVMTWYTHEEEIAEQLKRLTKTYDIRAAKYHVNVSNGLDIEQLLPQVQRVFGAVDALINMASVYQRDPDSLCMEVIEEYFRVAFGGMLLSHHFAARMRDQNRTDAPIITFGDWATRHPYRNYGLYLAAKEALQTYMKTLQVDFAGTIRIVNILPGMLQVAPAVSGAETHEIIKHTPTQNAGDPQQAARLTRAALECDFLVGDIYLDGGQHIRHRLD